MKKAGKPTGKRQVARPSAKAQRLIIGHRPWRQVARPSAKAQRLIIGHRAGCRPDPLAATRNDD